MGLFTPKWKSNNSEKREQWVENADRDNPKHQNILRNLALKDDEAFVREYAANKVTDTEILSYIILNESDRLTRMAAVESLNIMDDYNTLKSISEKMICRNEQDERVKKFIMEYLTYDKYKDFRK